MLAIRSLVLLLFLNPVWTSRSSQFKDFWSLAWRILNFVLLVCEMSATVWSLNILWHCLFWDCNLKNKQTNKKYFSSPVCPTEHPEQDSVFPTANLSHQETCTSLLSSSIRGQTEEARTTIPQPTEWKLQSQKVIQNDHMNQSLV